MKRKKVLWTLEALKTFERPKLELEQYATSAEMALDIVQAIDEEMGGLEGKSIADLGCGCGMLAIASSLVATPSFLLGVDVDEDALRICAENLKSVEGDIGDTAFDLMKADVVRSLDALLSYRFDVVLMNPPFGTKNNEGVDIQFVRAGFSIVRPGGRLFSLHKTSTRDFLLKTAKSWPSASAKCIAELRWELPATYRHHKQSSVDIEVDLICYRKKKDKS